MITAAQCRAARALLKWSQEDLAERSGIGVATIRTFETDASSPYKRTLQTLKTTFEEAGVAFIDRDEGVGVMLRKAFTAP